MNYSYWAPYPFRNDLYSHIVLETMSFFPQHSRPLATLSCVIETELLMRRNQGVVNGG